MACNVTLLPSIKQGNQEKDLPIVIPQKNLVFPIVLPLKFLSTVFSVCPGVMKTYWIIFPDITTLHLTKNQGCINCQDLPTQRLYCLATYLYTWQV